MKDIVMGMLILAVVILIFVTWFQHDDIRLNQRAIFKLIKSTEEQTEEISVQYDYINKLQLEHEEVFDAFEKVINYHQTNMVKRPDLAFAVEEMVNQYLEVHDER